MERETSWDIDLMMHPDSLTISTLPAHSIVMARCHDTSPKKSYVAFRTMTVCIGDTRVGQISESMDRLTSRC